MLVETLDALWRGIIRRAGVCAACGRRPPDVVIEAAHGFSRIYWRTRWRLDNGWCLCRGCHRYYTDRPEEWRDWMIERYQEGLFHDQHGWVESQRAIPDVAARARAVAEQKYAGMKALAFEDRPHTLEELEAIGVELLAAEMKP